MRFLVDTNILSELSKDRPEPAVEDWLDRQPREDLAVSALSFGEIRAGMLMMAEGRKKSRVRQWFKHTLEDQFADRVLPVNRSIALESGRLTAEAKQRGRRTDIVDLLLVATALVLGLPIVTRNVRHCAGWGANVINPWSDKASD
jgi:predicted nucleic acid-binding protein